MEIEIGLLLRDAILGVSAFIMFGYVFGKWVE